MRAVFREGVIAVATAVNGGAFSKEVAFLYFPNDFAKTAKWVHDLPRREGSSGDFSKRGLENHVVLIRGEACHFGRKPGLLKQLSNALTAVDPGGASAQNDDFLLESPGFSRCRGSAGSDMAMLRW